MRSISAAAAITGRVEVSTVGGIAARWLSELAREAVVLWLCFLAISTAYTADAQAQIGGFVRDPARGCQLWMNAFEPETLAARWTGPCTGGLASGRGTFTLQRKGELEVTGEGEFVAGRLQGRGFLVYADGPRVEGEFRDGSLNGRGIETARDGERHEGEWKDGQPNGYGVHTWPGGARFEGDWKDGEPYGPGVDQSHGKTVKANWTGSCLFQGGEKISLVVFGLSSPCFR